MPVQKARSGRAFRPRRRTRRRRGCRGSRRAGRNQLRHDECPTDLFGRSSQGALHRGGVPCDLDRRPRDEHRVDERQDDERDREDEHHVHTPLPQRIARPGEPVETAELFCRGQRVGMLPEHEDRDESPDGDGDARGAQHRSAESPTGEPHTDEVRHGKAGGERDRPASAPRRPAAPATRAMTSRSARRTSVTTAGVAPTAFSSPTRRVCCSIRPPTTIATLASARSPSSQLPVRRIVRSIETSSPSFAAIVCQAMSSSAPCWCTVTNAGVPAGSLSFKLSV